MARLRGRLQPRGDTGARRRGVKATRHRGAELPGRRGPKVPRPRGPRVPGCGGGGGGWAPTFPAVWALRPPQPPLGAEHFCIQARSCAAAAAERAVRFS